MKHHPRSRRVSRRLTSKSATIDSNLSLLHPCKNRHVDVSICAFPMSFKKTRGIIMRRKQFYLLAAAFLVCNAALQAQIEKAKPASEFQNSDYIEISKKRLLTISVTNYIVAKQNFHATIINQIPRPVPWRDGKSYEKLTNVSFSPYVPAVVWVKPGIDGITKKVIPTPIWQCNPQPACQWEWHVEGQAGKKIETSCTYQIVTAQRRLQTEKLHLTLADLKELPQDLLAATTQTKSALPANIISLAQSIVGNEEDPIKIIKKLSSWCGQNVHQEAADLNGKFINRYNIDVPVRESRGWCGPRSSTFRALCAVYGIPSREVSGYCLKESLNFVGGEINSRRGGPHGKNDANAHVWAEVFLPQVGWSEIEIGWKDPFTTVNQFVPVYGIEAPSVSVWDENGKWIPFDHSQNISVTSETID